MHTVPESHVLTAVCGDFELHHAANYSHGYTLVPCDYEQQIDSGFDSLTRWHFTAILVGERVPKVRNYETKIT